MGPSPLARVRQAATRAFTDKEYPLKIATDDLALPGFVNFFMRYKPILREGDALHQFTPATLPPVESTTSSAAYEASIHHRFVLVLNFATEGVIVADDTWVRLQEGQAFLIFPYQYHYFCNFASSKITWVLLTFEIGQPRSLEVLRDRVLTLTDEIMGDIERLSTLCDSHPNPIPEIRHEVGLLSALVLHGLLKLPSHETTLASAISKSAHDLVKSVGQYVRKHMSKGASVKELADHLALSESHLRHAFRAATGISIGLYIRRMRMLQAISLLNTTSLNISQVASRCGFSSLFAFSRAFSRHIGISPTDYRRRSHRS